MSVYEIVVPQLGVNDDMAIIIAVINRDNAVSENEVILELETSKAVFDVQAARSGFVKLFYDEGDEVETNQIIGIIATTSNELSTYQHEEKNEHIEITGKATNLAATLNVKVADIPMPSHGIITTKHVQAHHDEVSTENIYSDRAVILPHNVNFAIYGAGQGGMEIYAAHSNGGLIFIDDNRAGEIQDGKSILSKDVFIAMFGHYVTKPSVFVAIANGKKRVELINELAALEFEVINIGTSKHYGIASIHSIGIGIHRKPGCVIGNNVYIGTGCILDYNTTISHDSFLEKGVHIAPGASLGSSVIIGKYTVVGINAAIATGVTIGANCIISPGTSVTHNILDNTVVEGVPGEVIGRRK